MLYAAKIDDRHLSEQKLLEMAAFYTWLDFTLTDMHRAYPILIIMVRQLTDQLFCGTGSADSRPSGVPWSLTISTLYRAGGQAGAYLLLEYGEYDDAG